MAKKTAKETISQKPLKKIKSFNIDDRIYKGLMELFESSDAQISLSVLVDEFLRKLYVYLLEAQGVIGDSDFPFSRVIYDCRDIEYFRESNKKNLRVLNLFYSYQASRQGLSLEDWIEGLPNEAIIESDTLKELLRLKEKGK